MFSLIFRIMSDNQDNILDYKSDEIQGEDLLNQSANSEEEPMDQEVVVLEEVQQPADPGYMLACGDRDIFDEETYTVS